MSDLTLSSYLSAKKKNKQTASAEDILGFGAALKADFLSKGTLDADKNDKIDQMVYSDLVQKRGLSEEDAGKMLFRVPGASLSSAEQLRSLGSEGDETRKYLVSALKDNGFKPNTQETKLAFRALSQDFLSDEETSTLNSKLADQNNILELVDLEKVKNNKLKVSSFRGFPVFSPEVENSPDSAAEKIRLLRENAEKLGSVSITNYFQKDKPIESVPGLTLERAVKLQLAKSDFSKEFEKSQELQTFVRERAEDSSHNSYLDFSDAVSDAKGGILDRISRVGIEPLVSVFDASSTRGAIAGMAAVSSYTDAIQGEGKSSFEQASNSLNQIAQKYGTDVAITALNDVIAEQKIAARAVNPDDLSQNIGLLSDGTLVYSGNLPLWKDKFRTAVAKSSASLEEKKRILGDLDKISDVAAEQMVPTLQMADNDFDEVLSSTVNAGGTKADAVRKWVEGREDNYGGFTTRLELTGRSVLDSATGIFYGVGAMAGNDFSKQELLYQQSKRAALRAQGELFGSEFGIGMDLVEVAMPVVVDILITKGALRGLKAIDTGGSVANAASRTLTRTTAESAVGNAARTKFLDRAISFVPRTASSFLVNRSKTQLGRAGMEVSNDNLLRAMEIDFYNLSAKTGMYALSGVRSATGSFVSITSELNAENQRAIEKTGKPLYTQEEIQSRAVTGGTVSGLKTILITGILGSVGDSVGAVEDFFSRDISKLTTEQAENLLRRQLSSGTDDVISRTISSLSSSAQDSIRRVSADVFNAPSVREGLKRSFASKLRQVNTRFIRNVGSGFLGEGFEESIDQLAESFIQAAYTDKNITIGEAVSQAFDAFILGGALGGTVGAIKGTMESLEERRRKGEETNIIDEADAYVSALTSASKRLSSNNASLTGEVIEEFAKEAKKQFIVSELQRRLRESPIEPAEEPEMQESDDEELTEPENVSLSSPAEVILSRIRGQAGDRATQVINDRIEDIRQRLVDINSKIATATPDKQDELKLQSARLSATLGSLEGARRSIESRGKKAAPKTGKQFRNFENKHVEVTLIDSSGNPQVYYGKLVLTPTGYAVVSKGNVLPLGDTYGPTSLVAPSDGSIFIKTTDGIKFDSSYRTSFLARNGSAYYRPDAPFSGLAGPVLFPETAPGVFSGGRIPVVRRIRDKVDPAKYTESGIEIVEFSPNQAEEFYSAVRSLGYTDAEIATVTPGDFNAAYLSQVVAEREAIKQQEAQKIATKKADADKRKAERDAKIATARAEREARNLEIKAINAKKREEAKALRDKKRQEAKAEKEAEKARKKAEREAKGDNTLFEEDEEVTVEEVETPEADEIPEEVEVLEETEESPTEEGTEVPEEPIKENSIDLIAKFKALKSVLTEYGKTSGNKVTFLISALDGLSKISDRTNLGRFRANVENSLEALTSSIALKASKIPDEMIRDTIITQSHDIANSVLDFLRSVDDVYAVPDTGTEAQKDLETETELTEDEMQLLSSELEEAISGVKTPPARTRKPRTKATRLGASPTPPETPKRKTSPKKSKAKAKAKTAKRKPANGKVDKEDIVASANARMVVEPGDNTNPEPLARLADVFESAGLIPADTPRDSDDELRATLNAVLETVPKDVLEKLWQEPLPEGVIDTGDTELPSDFEEGGLFDDEPEDADMEDEDGTLVDTNSKLKALSLKDIKELTNFASEEALDTIEQIVTEVLISKRFSDLVGIKEMLRNEGIPLKLTGINPNTDEEIDIDIARLVQIQAISRDPAALVRPVVEADEIFWFTADTKRIVELRNALESAIQELVNSGTFSYSDIKKVLPKHRIPSRVSLPGVSVKSREIAPYVQRQVLYRLRKTFPVVDFRSTVTEQEIDRAILWLSENSEPSVWQRYQTTVSTGRKGQKLQLPVRHISTIRSAEEDLRSRDKDEVARFTQDFDVFLQSEAKNLRALLDSAERKKKYIEKSSKQGKSSAADIEQLNALERSIETQREALVSLASKSMNIGQSVGETLSPSERQELSSMLVEARSQMDKMTASALAQGRSPFSSQSAKIKWDDRVEGIFTNDPRQVAWLLELGIPVTIPPEFLGNNPEMQVNPAIDHNPETGEIFGVDYPIKQDGLEGLRYANSSRGSIAVYRKQRALENWVLEGLPEFVDSPLFYLPTRDTNDAGEEVLFTNEKDALRAYIKSATDRARAYFQESSTKYNPSSPGSSAKEEAVSFSALYALKSARELSLARILWQAGQVHAAKFGSADAKGIPTVQSKMVEKLKEILGPEGINLFNEGRLANNPTPEQTEKALNTYVNRIVKRFEDALDFKFVYRRTKTGITQITLPKTPDGVFANKEQSGSINAEGKAAFDRYVGVGLSPVSFVNANSFKMVINDQIAQSRGMVQDSLDFMNDAENLLVMSSNVADFDSGMMSGDEAIISEEESKANSELVSQITNLHNRLLGISDTEAEPEPAPQKKTPTAFRDKRLKKPSRPLAKMEGLTEFEIDDVFKMIHASLNRENVVFAYIHILESAIKSGPKLIGASKYRSTYVQNQSVKYQAMLREMLIDARNYLKTGKASGTFPSDYRKLFGYIASIPGGAKVFHRTMLKELGFQIDFNSLENAEKLRAVFSATLNVATGMNQYAQKVAPSMVAFFRDFEPNMFRTSIFGGPKSVAANLSESVRLGLQDGDAQSAVDALLKISEDSRNYPEALRVTARYLYKSLVAEDGTIKEDFRFSMPLNGILGLNAAGEYDPVNRAVSLNFLARSDMDGSLGEVLVHELIHHATVLNYLSSTPQVQQELTEMREKIKLAISESLGAKGLGLDSLPLQFQAALDSDLEFITTVLSSESFQKAIDRINIDGRPWYSRFFFWMAGLFGFRNGLLAESIKKSEMFFHRPKGLGFSMVPIASIDGGLERMKDIMTTSGLNIEVAPDPKNQNATDAWNKLPDIIKQRLTEEQLRRMLPQISSVMRLPVPAVERAIGGFSGQTNPSTIFRFPSGVSFEDQLAYAKAAGVVLSQQAVIGYDMEETTSDPSKGRFPVLHAVITFDSEADPQNVKELYDALLKVDPTSVSGFTVTGNSMVIGNFVDSNGVPYKADNLFLKDLNNAVAQVINDTDNVFGIDLSNGFFQTITFQSVYLDVTDTETTLAEVARTVKKRNTALQGESVLERAVEERINNLRADASATLEQEIRKVDPQLAATIDSLPEEGPGLSNGEQDAAVDEVVVSMNATLTAAVAGPISLVPLRTTKQTRNLLNKFNKTLSALGSRIIEITQDGDPRYRPTASYVVRSFSDPSSTHAVRVDLEALSYLTEEQIEAVMREEIIHAACGQALNSAGLDWVDVFESIASQMTKAERLMVQRVYTSLGTSTDLDSSAMASLGAEFFRIVIQKLRYGQITEQTMQGSSAFQNVLNVLRLALNYIRKVFTRNDAVSNEAKVLLSEVTRLLDIAEGKSVDTVTAVVRLEHEVGDSDTRPIYVDKKFVSNEVSFLAGTTTTVEEDDTLGDIPKVIVKPDGSVVVSYNPEAIAFAANNKNQVEAKAVIHGYLLPAIDVAETVSSMRQSSADAVTAALPEPVKILMTSKARRVPKNLVGRQFMVDLLSRFSSGNISVTDMRALHEVARNDRAATTAIRASLMVAANRISARLQLSSNIRDVIILGRIAHAKRTLLKGADPKNGFAKNFYSYGFPASSSISADELFSFMNSDRGELLPELSQSAVGMLLDQGGAYRFPMTDEFPQPNNLHNGARISVVRPHSVSAKLTGEAEMLELEDIDKVSEILNKKTKQNTIFSTALNWINALNTIAQDTENKLRYNLPNLLRGVGIKNNIERVIDFMASNLVSLWEFMPDDLLSTAIKWYDGARKIAEEMSSSTGGETSIRQSAAVIACLSPGMDWSINVEWARRVTAMHHSAFDTVIDDEMINRMMEEHKGYVSRLSPKEFRRKKKSGELLLRTQHIEASRGKTLRELFELSRSSDETLSAISAEKQLVNKEKAAAKLKEKRRLAREAKAAGVKLKKEKKSKKEKKEKTTIEVGSLEFNSATFGWAARYMGEAIFGSTYHVLSPSGEATGAKSRRIVAQSGENYTKAFTILVDGSPRIREGETEQDARNRETRVVSENLGNQYKVRSFFNNIIAPLSDKRDITSDTHSGGAVMLMPYGTSDEQIKFLSSGNGPAVLENRGGYWLVRAAHILAAERITQILRKKGILTEDQVILPRQVQSVTWDVLRTLVKGRKTVVKGEAFSKLYQKLLTVFSGPLRDGNHITTQEQLDSARREALKLLAEDRATSEIDESGNATGRFTIRPEWADVGPPTDGRYVDAAGAIKHLREDLKMEPFVNRAIAIASEVTAKTDAGNFVTTIIRDNGTVTLSVSAEETPTTERRTTDELLQQMQRREEARARDEGQVSPSPAELEGATPPALVSENLLGEGKPEITAGANVPVPYMPATVSATLTPPPMPKFPVLTSNVENPDIYTSPLAGLVRASYVPLLNELSNIRKDTESAMQWALENAVNLMKRAKEKDYAGSLPKELISDALGSNAYLGPDATEQGTIDGSYDADLAIAEADLISDYIAASSSNVVPQPGQFTPQEMAEARYNAAIVAAGNARDAAIRSITLRNIAAVKVKQDSAITAIRNTSPDLATAITLLRDKIDEMSEIIRDNSTDPGIQVTIDDRLGIHLVRAYHVHRGPNWAEEILYSTDPNIVNIRNNAVRFFSNFLVETEVKTLADNMPIGSLVDDGTGRMVPVTDTMLLSLATKNVSNGSNHLQLTPQKAMEQYVLEHSSPSASLGGFSPRGSTLSKDLRRLMQKKNVPQELRDLLGEVTDPASVAANTLSSLTRFAVNTRFINQFVTLGKSNGWLVTEEQRTERRMNGDSSADTYVPVISSSPENESLAPLAGLLGHPMMAKVIAELTARPNANSETIGEATVRTILSPLSVATRVSTLSVTILAIEGAIRNFWSSIGLFSLAQGISPLRILGNKKAWKTGAGYAGGKTATFAVSDPYTLRLVDAAIKHGMLGTDSTIAVLNQLRNYRYEQEGFSVPTEGVVKKIGRVLSNKILGTNKEYVPPLIRDIKDLQEDKMRTNWEKTKDGVSQVVPMASQLYSTGDTLTKLAMLDYEISYLEQAEAWARQNIPGHVHQTSEQIEAEAVRLVRNGMQYFRDVPAAVEAIMRSPISLLGALFLRFKADVARITVNTAKQIAVEVSSKNKIVRRRGYQRAVGFVSALFLGRIVAEILQQLFGIDDTKDKTIRLGLPNWQRDNTLLPLSPYFFARTEEDKTKRYGFLDVSYLSPFSIITDVAVTAGGNIIEGEFGAALGNVKDWFGESVIAEQILFQSVKEALTGELETGSSLYLSTDDTSEKIKRGTLQILKSMIPGSWNTMNKLYEASQNTVYGSEESRKESLGSLALFMMVGTKIRSYSKEYLVSKNVRQLNAQSREIDEEIGKTLGAGKTLTEAEVISAYDRLMENRVRLFSKLRDTHRAAIGLGFSPSDADLLLRGTSLSTGKKTNLFSPRRINLAVEQNSTERIVLSPTQLNEYAARAEESGEGAKARTAAIQKAISRYDPVVPLSFDSEKFRRE